MKNFFNYVLVFKVRKKKLLLKSIVINELKQNKSSS